MSSTSHPDKNALRQRKTKIPIVVTVLRKKLTIPEHTQQRMAETSLSILNRLTNPYTSLLGAVCSLLIMFCIHWGFALAAICAGLLLYVYIGHANSGLPPGQADFRLSQWCKSLVMRARGRRDKLSYSQPNGVVGSCQIVTEAKVPFDYSVQQQTEGCDDYDQRPLYHHQEIHQANPTMKLPLHVSAPHLSSTSNHS